MILGQAGKRSCDSIAFWLWCRSIVGVRPMVPPNVPKVKIYEHVSKFNGIIMVIDNPYYGDIEININYDK